MLKMKINKKSISIISVVLVLVVAFGVILFNPFKPKSKIVSQKQPVSVTLSNPSTALIEQYSEDYMFARNPWDMQTYNGKVYISAGDYGANSGPTKIICYDSKDGSFEKCDSIYSDQVSRFYVLDDCLYTVSVDPVSWGVGEFYRKTKNDENDWFEPYSVLPSFVHCLDMAEFDDKLFFCGQVMNPDEYGMIQYIEKNDMPVEFIDTTKHAFIYKDGKEITGDYIRIVVCELIVFEDNLYAWHNSSERIGDPYEGLYIYNKEECRFDYIEGEKTLTPVIEKGDNQYDYDVIQAQVEYDGKLVFANNGLLFTDDLKNYTECNFGKGCEDFVARDLLVIEDQLYILSSKKLENGKFKTCVFVTEDLEKFSEVLNFEADSYMISFEYIDKTFIFGEGGTNKDTADSCGNLYAVKVD